MRLLICSTDVYYTVLFVMSLLCNFTAITVKAGLMDINQKWS